MGFRFQDFPVYRDSRVFVTSVIKLIDSFSGQAQRELGSQIRKAALSIVLNIAEGSGKGSDRDFNRFIRMSLGSLNEVIAGLDVAKDNYFISDEAYGKVYIEAEYLGKQLGGFSKTLGNS